MDEKTDLISIIVPVYNAAGVLPRCLDSLLGQTISSIEIILINDGSKDDSLSICETYANKAGNITVISQENGGAAKARNAGLDVAHGDYVMFVDADDYVKENICEILLKAVKDSDVTCAVSQLDIVAIDGSSTTKAKISESRILSGKESLHEMYCGSNCGVSLVEVCGKLFHHSMWEKLRFSEGMYYEDLDIMPELYYNCENLVEVPYMGYYYMTYEESASHGKGTDDKRVWDSIMIREKHIDFYKDRGDEELALSINSRLLDLIVTAAKSGWIPNDRIPDVVNTFKKYWKQYKKSASIPTKIKLKYEAFCLGGKQSFKVYQG